MRKCISASDYDAVTSNSALNAKLLNLLIHPTKQTVKIPNAHTFVPSLVEMMKTNQDFLTETSFDVEAIAKFLLIFVVQERGKYSLLFYDNSKKNSAWWE